MQALPTHAYQLPPCVVVQSYPLPPERAISPLEPATRCPLCNFQVLNVAGDGADLRGFTMCPYCYTRPPASATVDSNFKCVTHNLRPSSDLTCETDVPMNRALA